MLTKETIREIRAMLERKWTAVEIAHKLCIPAQEVQAVIRVIH